MKRSGTKKHTIDQVQRDVRHSFVVLSMTNRCWCGWMEFLDVFSKEHGLKALKGLKRTTTIKELVRKAEDWLFANTETKEAARYYVMTKDKRPARELDFLTAIYKKHGIGKTVFERLTFLYHMTGTLFVEIRGANPGVADELFLMESTILEDYLHDNWKKGDEV